MIIRHYYWTILEIDFRILFAFRNQFLILAHFQRLHHLLSPALRAALDILLEYELALSFVQLTHHRVAPVQIASIMYRRSSDLITESMMEIAYIRGWTLTLQAVMDFRRCLIQGLENMSSSSSLLQIPHFNPSVVKHCLKGKNAVKDLRGFIAQSPEERKGLADMTETWKVREHCFSKVTRYLGKAFGLMSQIGFCT